MQRLFLGRISFVPMEAIVWTPTATNLCWWVFFMRTWTELDFLHKMTTLSANERQRGKFLTFWELLKGSDSQIINCNYLLISTPFPSPLPLPPVPLPNWVSQVFKNIIVLPPKIGFYNSLEIIILSKRPKKPILYEFLLKGSTVRETLHQTQWNMHFPMKVLQNKSFIFLIFRHFFWHSKIASRQFREK